MKLFKPAAMFLQQMRASRSLGRCFICNHSYDHAVAELNKEMESIFGDPPHAHESGSEGLTHVDNRGHAKMVDVSLKEDSKRVAIAGCRVMLGRKVFELVASNQIAKGDVLNVAKMAAINGAKQTSSLIPLCHNIGLTHVRIEIALNEKELSVDIEGEVAATGKTGVEMEAMTAVTIAGLTVYDMCKAASKEIRVTDIRLEHKRGGKSGDWSRGK